MSLELRRLENIRLTNQKKTDLFNLDLTSYDFRTNPLLYLEKRRRRSRLKLGRNLTAAKQQAPKLLHQRVQKETHLKAFVLRRTRKDIPV